MNPAPFGAQLRNMGQQIRGQLANLRAIKPKALAQRHWPGWTIQQQHSLPLRPYHMHMRRRMIIREDRHPVPMKA